MKTRIAAVAAAFILGVAAPVSLAAAAPYGARYAAPVEVETTGSIGLPVLPFFDGRARDPRFCAPSSAAEGNARQQNFPVQQYDQTSGGNRC